MHLRLSHQEEFVFVHSTRKHYSKRSYKLRPCWGRQNSNMAPMTFVLGVTPVIILHGNRYFEDVIKAVNLLTLNEEDS